MGKISKELDQKRTRNSNVSHNYSMIWTYIRALKPATSTLTSLAKAQIRYLAKASQNKSISDSSDSFNPLSIDGEIKRKIIRKKRNNGFSSPYSGHVFVTFFF